MNSSTESKNTTATGGEKLEPQKIRLVSEPSQRLMAYIERCYWEFGDLPTVEKCAEETGLTSDEIKSMWGTEVFQKTLIEKGLHFRNKENSTLTAMQIIAANALLNTLDNHSTRMILKGLGVSEVQYQAWLSDPVYVEYLRKRTEAMFKNADMLAMKAHIKNIERGDQKAIETYYRMQGIWEPTVGVNINVKELLVQVVDIIQLHVKDPEVMEAIATDLDMMNAQGQGTRNHIGQSIPLGIGSGDSDTDT